MFRGCLVSILLQLSVVSLLSAEQMLVSSAWLEPKLADPNVVVLHAGTSADYDAGHIPGARLIRLEDVSVTDASGLTVELPRVEPLRQLFSKLGVTDESQVVVYAAAGVPPATRVWFTLDYLGLGARAALLDGGLALWKKEGRPLSKEAVPPASGTFTPRPAPVRVAGADWLRMHLADPSVMIVDARTPEFFTGADQGAMPRAGRIPGARNETYTAFFDAGGRFKSPEALRRMLGVGERGAEPVRVTYCHVGNSATVPYFVARYLGLEARLFDGSFQEWSRRKDLPVEHGAADSQSAGRAARGGIQSRPLKLAH